MAVYIASTSWMKWRKNQIVGYLQSLRWPMFPLEVTDIQNSPENWYCGYLEYILQCDFNSFKVVLFVVQWYRLWLNQRDPNKTIVEHDNGFTMVNTRFFEPGTKPCVHPSQWEHGFYFEVLSRWGWSFVMRYGPRGR